MAREPDSFNVSTCPRRTVVENSSPSRTTHSAAVAPPFIARLTTSVAISLRSVTSFVSLVSSVVVMSKSKSTTETRRGGENQPCSLFSLGGTHQESQSKNHGLTINELAFLRNPVSPW